MTTRNFNNVATVGTLAGPLASSATSATLSNFNSTPTVPFTATIDRNTATEEIVLVTALLGGTATLTRGYDGTSAQAHSAGALIEHTAGAIEYNEANHHVNTTVNVHGSTGNVVGDQGSQTLFDKTLVSPVVQANVASGDAVVAYIPPGATSKNMYTGVGSDGLTKFSVTSSGVLTAAGVNLTTLNSTVAGHTTTIGSHTTSIASLNSTVGSHTSSISTLNSTDTTQNSRLNALEALGNRGSALTGASAFTPASGWSLEATGCLIKKMGNSTAMMQLSLTRTGANIVAGGSGNLANITIATINGSYQPAQTVPLSSFAGGPVCSGYLSSGGAVVLAAVPPNYTVTTGSEITFGIALYAL